MFPTAPGRFLFGPMALIGWGTPDRADRGDRGGAGAAGADAHHPAGAACRPRSCRNRAPLVRINMDALGVLDLGQERAVARRGAVRFATWSRYTLSGDMALRATWAAQREFLLAIGGFHPRFTPPPDFPRLQRITIDMPSGALSQAAAGGLSRDHLEHRAIRRRPRRLHRRLRIRPVRPSGVRRAAAVCIRSTSKPTSPARSRITGGGDDLMSVGLDATLSGPAPWNIAGQLQDPHRLLRRAQVVLGTPGARMRRPGGGRRWTWPAAERDAGGPAQLGRAAAGRRAGAGRGATHRGSGQRCWRIRWRGWRCTSGSCRWAWTSAASARRRRSGASAIRDHGLPHGRHGRGP